ncbi:MAG: hypothetical protein IKR48_06565 [Kiritimatiellae bacterium]|nr:hypothetical protein [Kiritimatiellia bacterium]
MNEKINVILLGQFFKGSGFKKIHDESKKTYDELKQLGKIKFLNEDVGKSFGVLGGDYWKDFFQNRFCWNLRIDSWCDK